MASKNTNEMVQKYIADGLMAYKILAKHYLKKRWKNLSLADKTKSARSLVVMDIVAKEPDCFSRANTEATWKMRAAEYAKKHNFKPDEYFNAFYIVEDPKGIVWNQARFAMEYPLDSQYYSFLSNIQNYEYGHSCLKDGYAREIKEDAERVCAKVDNLKLVFKKEELVKRARNFIKGLAR